MPVLFHWPPNTSSSQFMFGMRLNLLLARPLVNTSVGSTPTPPSIASQRQQLTNELTNRRINTWPLQPGNDNTVLDDSPLLLSPSPLFALFPFIIIIVIVRVTSRSLAHESAIYSRLAESITWTCHRPQNHKHALR